LVIFKVKSKWRLYTFDCEFGSTPWVCWSAFDPKSVSRRHSRLVRREERLSRSRQSQWNLIWLYAELHTSPIGWITCTLMANVFLRNGKWNSNRSVSFFVNPHHRKCTLNFYLRFSFSYWKRSSNFYFRFPFSLGFVQQNWNCHFRFFSRTYSLTSNMTPCTVLIRNWHSLLDTMITAKPLYTWQTTDSGNAMETHWHWIENVSIVCALAQHTKIENVWSCSDGFSCAIRAISAFAWNLTWNLLVRQWFFFIEFRCSKSKKKKTKYKNRTWKSNVVRKWK